ncbi:MAG: hypothetical protein M3N29_05675 [Chloroflexota bacterium]|nr:hypothetical protein [Chloroflexota bacterium]
MQSRFVRSFAEPDELTKAELLRSELVHLGGMTISRDVHEPGWRWSTHVRPLVGTEWCELRHMGFVLAGRLRVRLGDGTEFEVTRGDVINVPAGHDAWVAGDEPFEVIAWLGVRGWLGSLEVAPERVVTNLVMTDIIGSTPLAKQLGDRYWGELLEQHMSASREAIGHFRGELVDLTGDGLLARFDGALRAVHCALALRNSAITLDLPLRTAVHTGEVEVTEAGLRGVALHETARMLALAGQGEVVVSATVRALVSGSGLQLTDLGEQELRGLHGTYRLYRLDAG